MDRVTESVFAAFDLVVNGDEIYARPTVPDGQRVVELEGHVADDLAEATRAENHLRRCMRLCDGYRDLVRHDIEIPEVLDTVWRTALVSYAAAFNTSDEHPEGGPLAAEIISTLGPLSTSHAALLLQNDQYLRSHYGSDSTRTFAVVSDVPGRRRSVLAIGAVEMPFGRSHAVDVRVLETLAAHALAIAETSRVASEHRIALEVAEDPIETICSMNELRFPLG
ncbi:hypothetical protein HII28_11895 [Planctomonas sp. JC2975]|uniref:hypothetical protein n=1 Tax=Planctomonas sp. JC2975 TaxID=2729626 RepID=UPI00147384CC|nr:hypothetical protein [Planctomonas sp. JC2975]NNC12577.1 hypothetical protein [Planctomonas sp. JC2975]